MPNDTSKKKTIYYDNLCPDIFAYQPEGDFPIAEFDSYAQLVFHCLKTYGQEIEFHEVTQFNWQELHDSGAFD
jgi:hypothetical protein